MSVEFRRQKHLGGNVIGGDPDTFEPKVWRYLVDEFGVRSVLDVGCGEGYSTREFQLMGLRAIGVDGLRENADALPGIGVVVHDLTSGPLYVSSIDLVWCCEVAEHIVPQCEKFLIDTLKCGRVVAMTSSPEIGIHHVNRQSPEYWKQRMSEVGYWCNSRVTEEARAIAEHGFFKGTGLVFVRNDQKTD